MTEFRRQGFHSVRLMIEGHSCADTILGKTKPNISYGRKNNVFSDDTVLIFI